ncbi:MAG TPA: protease inhibitor I42 family protein [Dehalococcoidia bacterium]|nr:protease inhibitor I42 family protein [Dehalococcoidia bacterium]
MKLKVILVCAIGTISLLFSGCSADDEVSLRASCDDFYKQGEIIKEVQVPTGDSFKVSLCCTPSTAFKWSETASISDETVIKQINHKFVMAPPGGTPDQEIWTFKAIKEGASIITIENSHQLEGNKNRGWTFVLTAIVD